MFTYAAAREGFLSVGSVVRGKLMNSCVAGKHRFSLSSCRWVGRGGVSLSQVLKSQLAKCPDTFDENLRFPLLLELQMQRALLPNVSLWGRQYPLENLVRKCLDFSGNSALARLLAGGCMGGGREGDGGRGRQAVVKCLLPWFAL